MAAIAEPAADQLAAELEALDRDFAARLRCAEQSAHDAWAQVEQRDQTIRALRRELRDRGA